MSTAAPLLAVRDLGLRIGRRQLIGQLSLSVGPGELWCILGANGVGKSLLLHTLAGLRKIDSGTVSLSGRALADWSAVDAARTRSFLPQTIHDAFSAQVLDVVLMGRHPHLSRWQWEGDADRDIALAALAAVGLSDLTARDITTLSGGERQRVAIAALLTQDVPLMLLDEPINHLDLHHQILVLQHLVSVAKNAGKAVIYSIHDLNLAVRFSTHAILFRKNGGVDHGPVAAVMNDEALSSAYKHPVCQMKIGEQTYYVAG